MKEFDLDFQKETSVKQAKITKVHQKNAGFKANSMIRRLLTSIKKLQTKVVDSVTLGIHCKTFFQLKSVFPQF